MANRGLQLLGDLDRHADAHGHDHTRPEARFELRRAWRATDRALGQEHALAARLQGSLAALDHLLQGTAVANPPGPASVAELVRTIRQDASAWMAMRAELAATIDALHVVSAAIAEDCDRYAERCWRQVGRLSKAHTERRRRIEQLEERSQQLKIERLEAARARRAVQLLHRRLVRTKRIAATSALQSDAASSLPRRWLIALEAARQAIRPEGRSDRPTAPATAAPADLLPRLALSWRLPTGPERQDLQAVLPPSIPLPTGRWHAASPRGRLPVVALIVMGLRGAALTKVVEEATDEAAQRRWYVPLFVTDADDFEPFRTERYAFEYLPGAAARMAQGDDLDWPLYYARKAALIRNKWTPASVLVIGDDPPFDPAALCRKDADDGMDQADALMRSR